MILNIIEFIEEYRSAEEFIEKFLYPLGYDLDKTIKLLVEDFKDFEKFCDIANGGEIDVDNLARYLNESGMHDWDIIESILNIVDGYYILRSYKDYEDEIFQVYKINKDVDIEELNKALLLAKLEN